MTDEARAGLTRGRERLGLAGLCGLYLVSVLPNLGNHPIVGGDEGWIMSASAKLARDGVFGSNLFAGFYGAEDHYYFNLPLHHLVLAGVFKVFGAGLVQARLVSAVFGLATLVLAYAIGRKVGGPRVGLAGAALLLVLRLNLTPLTGLTLTDLGATVRYDLVSLPYALGAVWLLAREPRGPGMRTAIAAGVLVGLSALTQFIGAFFVAPLSLFILTASLPATRRLALTAAFVAATVLPFVPYGAYLVANWDDFRGQARATEQETDVLSPSFYADNLRHEPDRYALSTGLRGLPGSLRESLKRPSARLALYLVAPIAALVALNRARRGSRLHLLLVLLLAGLALQLALFESTKRFVYWVIVAPFVAIAIADLGLALLRWRPPIASVRRFAVAAAVAAGAVFLAEGVAVGATALRDARDAADYATLGARISAVVPAGARVVGDNRLWLTLEGRDARSLLLLFYYTNPRISRDRVMDVAGAMDRIDADYLLLSPLTKEILGKLTPQHSRELAAYLDARARLVDTIPFPDYGPVEVFKLSR